ncbi:hypothetical protein [Streptomyces sp. 4F14]|uniref:hypothetical protein n=1 Tax=Streptomyces sp. 4F14 TaxID=3394380 RepID=UPI003A8AFDAF
MQLPRPVFEPVVDQHESWLALNPRQGCPKACTYCFLKDRGLTRVRPTELAAADDAVRQLLTSPYYHPEAAVALYTCTDALATPPNRRHLIRLLDALAAALVPNPLVMITKCAVTDDVLDSVVRNRDTHGQRVIVYLSYSGLGPTIELGIDHQALRANFPRLHAAGVPIVHYWRPALPDNSSPDSIETVLGLATRYADCSVSIGLKVPPGSRHQMEELWPALAHPDLDPESADSIWPDADWEALRNVPARYAGHPIYQTNSCALAHVLHQPDRFRVLDTPTCRHVNRCPTEQRTLCTAAARETPPITENAITQHLTKLGHPGIPYHWDAQNRTLTIDVPVDRRVCLNTSQVLQLTVHAQRRPQDPYWTSRFNGSRTLIVEAEQRQWPPTQSP